MPWLMRSIPAILLLVASLSPATAQEAGDSTVAVTVAEGVGATADEALKDAFRNAVRQVVGAVVDAQVLVKNDEVIEDKVLTYSNGFISKYEKLSEKTQGGLVRIKIRAVVEQRKVVEKLKAASVAIREVAGTNLAAKVETQLEEEKNAEALVRKALEGFPEKYIKAEVVGDPEVVKKSEEKVTLRVAVQFSADQEAYQQFVKSFQALLERIARDKGEFTVVSKWVAPTPQYHIVARFDSLDSRMEQWMPKSYTGNWIPPKHKANAITIALNTTTSKLQDRLEFSYYLADDTLKGLFLKTSCRRAQCKIALLAADGTTIAVDRFWPGQHEFPLSLIAPLCSTHVGDAFDTGPRDIVGFMVASVFLQESMSKGLRHRPFISCSREIEVFRDEVKSLSSAKCDLQFETRERGYDR